MKSPLACKNAKNVDSSNNANEFNAQSQVLFPPLSYMESATDTSNNPFLALIMNLNTNIFKNIQDNVNQVLESSIVYIDLYNITG